MSEMIPFTKMSVVGNEEKYLLEALRSGKWCGRGPKTLALEKLVRETCGVQFAFLVTSGTAALELGCLLADIGPGDEVILPSFGFVSAANAVVLRGGKPVFADIDRETWNVSAATIGPLITKNTKAVIPVHYGGNAAGIDEIRDLCRKHRLFLIEDAAQSLGAKHHGKLIGPTPWVTCFSLHETKNISSGEGGLILTDSAGLAAKIEIQIEKGTNRQKFLRGQVDKYTWVDLGSSLIASDLLAAVALAQMENLETVSKRRIQLYERIKSGLKSFEGLISWQTFPSETQHNGHACGFVINPEKRDFVLKKLREKGVNAVFHYVPLHDSPFAKEKGYSPSQDLPQTRLISEGLVRLPLFYSMTDAEADRVVAVATEVLQNI